jgi:hypothetical protein
MTNTTHEIDELSLVEMDVASGGSWFTGVLTLGGLNPLSEMIKNAPALPHGNANGFTPNVPGPGVD